LLRFVGSATTSHEYAEVFCGDDIAFRIKRDMVTLGCRLRRMEVWQFTDGVAEEFWP
jgi:hypothetical protein